MYVYTYEFPNGRSICMGVEGISFSRIVVFSLFFNVKDHGPEARYRAKELREGTITIRIRKTNKRLTSPKRYNPPATNSAAPLPPLASTCTKRLIRAFLRSGDLSGSALMDLYNRLRYMACLEDVPSR
jgi:hypothetical protein